LDKYAVNMRNLGTNDLLLRRLTLYPTEVRGHIRFWNDYAWICGILSSWHNALRCLQYPLYVWSIPEQMRFNA